MTTSKKKRAVEHQPTASRNIAAKGSATRKPIGAPPGRKAGKASPVKGSTGSGYKYKLKFHPEALDEWYALDNSVRVPLKKLLGKRLDNPRVPGGELHPPLTGCYKIKMKKAGARLVYQVEEDAFVVYVLAVDKREDSAVYASAHARIASLTAEILATAKSAK